MSKIDDFLYKCTLDDYINFYNKLPKVNKLKSTSSFISGNKDYHHLTLVKSKSSPALCHVQKYIRDIPLDSKYYTFYSNNPTFWMIPVTTISDRIAGFILKGFHFKNYHWIHYSKISLLFGFYDFHDFKRGMPIIIVEGWRDALFVKQYYKYCLALNTSSLNRGTLELLKNFTNKIIFILDNDATGKKMSITNKKMCMDNKILAQVIHPVLKDMGEYFDDNSHYDKFEHDLKFAFDELTGDGNLIKWN